MNNFIFQNATKVYFGKGVAKEYLKDRTASAQTILLAYGGGSIKRNSIYDKITGIFNDAGKTIVNVFIAGERDDTLVASTASSEEETDSGDSQAE